MEPLAEHLFGRDERSVQELVLELCRDQGLTLGTAESCTGGLVAGPPHLGAGLERRRPGRDRRLRQRHQGDAARRLAGAPRRARRRLGRGGGRDGDGARERLGVDVAVSVTGIAGPGGGTPEKPVGLVFFHAVGPDGRDDPCASSCPGEREWIRARAAVSALHLVRRLLEG